ncbi:TPA: hypothetical protein HA351_09465 [Methanosarcinaceae archaeon]|nr:hypothetical protein [Methanosarcinaceae archaeon]
MEIEDRVATLETEFKIIKGEIKALLLDVRETVNDMENPFRSPGQAIGNMGGMNERFAEAKDFPAIENPLIKEIPAVDDIEDKIEKENEEVSGAKALPIEEKFTAAEVKKFRLEDPDDEKPESQLEIQEMQDKIPKIPQEPAWKVPEIAKGPELQEEKAEKAKPKEAPPEVPKITMENGINTYTLVELMRWTDYTLSTIGRKKLEEVLDLYALTGYLPDKVKDVILNIAKLSTANMAEDNQVTMTDNITVVSQLHEILSPEDSGRKIHSKEISRQKGLSLN